MRYVPVFLYVLSCCANAQTTCSRTPELAARGISGTPVEFGESGGYRMVGVRRDLVGAGVWVEVRSCAHPEWPAHLLPAAADVALPRVAATELAVRFGERVLIRQQSASGRMQIAGIAERSGVVGDVIPVSIMAFGEMGGVRKEAVIRRKGEVELR